MSLLCAELTHAVLLVGLNLLLVFVPVSVRVSRVMLCIYFSVILTRSLARRPFDPNSVVAQLFTGPRNSKP